MSTTFMPVTKPHRFGVSPKEVADLAERLRGTTPSQSPAERVAQSDAGNQGPEMAQPPKKRAW